MPQVAAAEVTVPPRVAAPVEASTPVQQAVPGQRQSDAPGLPPAAEEEEGTSFPRHPEPEDVYTNIVGAGARPSLLWVGCCSSLCGSSPHDGQGGHSCGSIVKHGPSPATSARPRGSARGKVAPGWGGCTG